jgi:glycosyltransferase involved in cell wall biosynthesis
VLAILTTHPIQYQVPLWQALAARGRVPFEVWYLTDHGSRVTLDKDFGKRFAWDLPLLDGYRHRFLPINKNWSMDIKRPWDIRLSKPLRPFFQEGGVTRLWINGWQKLAYWQAVGQARDAGVKIWLRAESNDLAPRRAWKRILRKRVHAWLFRRVDQFLYIGSANRRLYLGGGAPENRLQPAPYGIDNGRFRSQAEKSGLQRREIRKHWGIPESAFCVLFCGKFVPMKRPSDVVAAVQLLQRSAAGSNRIGPGNHLLFVGSGVLGSALRESVRIAFDADSPGANAQGSEPSKASGSFAGFLNQTKISDAYVAADCLVLPSDYGETWGLVVNEAMASGLPCIVSDAVGCGEDLVVPINPRLRYRMGDIGSLARALEEVRNAPPSRDLLIAQVAKFDIDVTVKTVEKLWADETGNSLKSRKSFFASMNFR